MEGRACLLTVYGFETLFNKFISNLSIYLLVVHASLPFTVLKLILKCMVMTL